MSFGGRIRGGAYPTESVFTHHGVVGRVCLHGLTRRDLFSPKSSTYVIGWEAWWKKRFMVRAFAHPHAGGSIV